MKHRRFFILPAAILIMLLIACKSGDKSGTDQIDLEGISLEEDTRILDSKDTVGQGLPIFYNMYLSVEMSTLFESIGAVFDADLLNSTSKISEYITSSKKALNLGVYAVDLSYSRIFEQIEYTGRYFNAMQKLSEELGIPSDYFQNTAKKFDRNINDKDSLIIIANEVYDATDNYLKENERYSAAAEIILGGWTEALHIAVDVANESKQIEIFERVAEQKYSLENLIDMLENYKDDEIILDYLNRLKQLRQPFNKLYEAVNADFDPSSSEGKKHIETISAQITRLGKNIDELRKEIIS
jgi:archaellum component FlaC